MNFLVLLKFGWLVPIEKYFLILLQCWLVPHSGLNFMGRTELSDERNDEDRPRNSQQHQEDSFLPMSSYFWLPPIIRTQE
ncbi:hypothetical protein KP509_27G056000 [Ceratopteris richardii]|uniref:Uncharacterized protein n=1 Tax=Ceratopteris richardii TaxID=49495 RepID=A0A8T2RGN9_CERRI|nr:hypothetical protein KP509_27G056000 [Ceratopteris richardii]KAH7295587.1 hypothetical protein KP509_27G056000 [Ceratopteris richardii]KAH7295588.1 hypothetical protein KP509_27G056000 [Ceratopteris richardii]KAH7295589.1 hypothetical protein KP509_27G056000 [Ceratopteris richardii]